MEESPDIATVFDDHVAAEFVTRDLDAAMATMAPDPYVFHVPSMAGGDGHDERPHASTARTSSASGRRTRRSRPSRARSARPRWWTS